MIPPSSRHILSEFDAALNSLRLAYSKDGIPPNAGEEG